MTNGLASMARQREMIRTLTFLATFSALLFLVYLKSQDPLSLAVGYAALAALSHSFWRKSTPV